MVTQLPKIAFPQHIENSYEQELKSFASRIIHISKQEIESFKKRSTEYREYIRRDELDTDLDNLIENMNFKIAIYLRKLINEVPAFAREVNRFNCTSVQNSVASIRGYSLNRINTDAVKFLKNVWIRENVRLIKTIPANLFNSLEQVIADSLSIGRSPTRFAEELQKQFNISKNRALLIARDQIGKLNGYLTRQRNLDLGISHYKWLTSNDDRVRKERGHSHKALEGKVCNWNDSSKYQDKVDGPVKQRSSIGATLNHPGIDIQCRCTSVGVIA